MSERKFKTEDGKFTHEFCLKHLDISQDADRDNRERAREDLLFVSKPNGMWEPDESAVSTDKPKYSFDLVTPILNQITGELQQADFAVMVEPLGGEASEDVADTYQGLVRNIENISYAGNRAYNPAALSSTTCGIGGWRIVHDYVDDDSFDQDLIIKGISNFHDRVWFDANSEMRDCSDAEFCWVMHALTPESYEARFGKDKVAASLDPDVEQNAYWHKKGVVIVGEFYYLREEMRELVLMSNGNIYEAEEYDKIKDEIAEDGLPIEEVGRRKRKKKICYVRKFDRDGWLEEEKKTPFSFLPVVPEFANFRVIDNKVIYHGAVTKMKDAQRVLNYSLSRQVEEVALAPREKLVMTRDQAKGHEAKLASMNTNTDPVMFYDFVEGQPPPFKIGGPQMNPGLNLVTQTMNQIINQVGGMFAANMGDNPNAQSGVAIKALQDKGDNGTYEYTLAHEVALCHTFRVLVDAIPKVYSEKRQARILNEDGTSEMVMLNATVLDEETGEEVRINDLSQGVYSVSCEAGPAFRNRQDQAVQSILEVAQYKPEILEIGSDIFLNNVTAPGMKEVSERLRQQLFNANMIPFSQMTDEEKEMIKQAQMAQQAQGNQPSPEEMIGQAELINAQTDQQKAMADVQGKQGDLALKFRKQQLEEAKFGHTQQKDVMTQILDSQKQQAEYLQMLAETMKTIREAMGSKVEVVSGSALEAFDNQANQVLQNQ